MYAMLRVSLVWRRKRRLTHQPIAKENNFINVFLGVAVLTNLGL